MKKSLADSVLEKIKCHHLMPRPRWHYVLRDAVFWGVFFFSILLGSLGIAVILYALLDTDFDFISYVPTSQLGAFLKLLPVVWIVFFGIFVGVAIWGAQHTKKGYKLSILWISVINFLVSLFFGGVIYAVGGGAQIERVFAWGVPFYQRFEERRKDMWRRQKGSLLAGEIMAVLEDKIIVLNDLSSEQWEVDYSEAMSRVPFEPVVGMKVRMIGEKVLDHQFKAFRISPWRRRGRMGRRRFFDESVFSDEKKRLEERSRDE